MSTDESFTQTRYRAFISYSRQDEQRAVWLQRKLERFSLPSGFPANTQSKHPLKPIFRDKDELRVDADLAKTINGALQNSQSLIVVCSPSAVKSEWVSREIVSFQQLHPQGKILPVIVSGAPNAENPEDECFPLPLRYKLDDKGQPIERLAELLAADLRSEGDGKRLALLKTAATLLSVELNQLLRRDAQRRMRVMAVSLLAMMLISFVMTALTYNAITARREAMEAMNLADTRRLESEGLIEFMLTDLKDRLIAVGRLDILDAIGDEALLFYEDKRSVTLDPETRGRKARAMLLLGEISFMRGYAEQATKIFGLAESDTRILNQATTKSPEQVYDHAQSVFWLGYVAWQKNDFSEAEKWFSEYLALSKELVTVDPDNRDWQLELLYAYSNLGNLHQKQGRYSLAEEYLLQSVDIANVLLNTQANDPDLIMERADSLSLLTHIYVKQYRINDALTSNNEDYSAYRELFAASPEDRWLQDRYMQALRVRAEIALTTGDIERSITMFSEADSLAENLYQHEPDNTQTLEKLARIKLFLTNAYLRTKNIHLSSRYNTGCLDLAARLVELNPENFDWQVDIQYRCQHFSARIKEASGEKDSAINSLAEHRQTLKEAQNTYPGNHLLIELMGANLLSSQRLCREVKPDEKCIGFLHEAFSVLDGDRTDMSLIRLSLLIQALSQLGRDQEAAELSEPLRRNNVDPGSIII